MSTLLFSNNASTALASTLAASSGATTCSVTTGTGAEFPSPGAGQYFVVTLQGAVNPALNEICWCTNVTGDTLTLVRGQEGTSIQAWAIGDTVANYWTAGQAAAMQQLSTAQQQAGNYAVDSGTANAMVAALSPAPASLASMVGAPVRIKKSAAANTGAVTLNLNGFGIKSVVLPGGAALVSGELPANGLLTVSYDGTSFEVQSLLNLPAAPTPAFTQYAQSGQTSVSASVSWAHGLGVQPKGFSVVMHCVSADSGFSVGDELQCPVIGYDGVAGGTAQGMSVSCNVTSVTVAYSGNLGSTNPSTGAYVNLTAADWKFIFRAWA